MIIGVDKVCDIMMIDMIFVTGWSDIIMIFSSILIDECVDSIHCKEGIRCGVCSDDDDDENWWCGYLIWLLFSFKCNWFDWFVYDMWWCRYWGS